MTAEATTKAPRSRARLALTWLVGLVLVAFLAVVLASVAVLIVVPRMSHGTALDVLTGSMTPDIPVGSIVIDRPVDPGTLHVGDIATYQKAPGVNEYITHRIIRINTKTTPTSFIFKGDANRGPDITPVPATAIRGKVWFHVPYLGAIRDGLKGAMGRTLLLFLIMLGLAAFAVKQFAEEFRARKRRRTGAERASSDADAALPTLVMSFDLDTFGDVDPDFVARLLQGVCEVVGDTFLLIFAADQSRLDVLRELLAPYGVEVEQDPAEAAEQIAAEATGIVSLVKSRDREPIHA